MALLRAAGFPLSAKNKRVGIFSPLSSAPVKIAILELNFRNVLRPKFTGESNKMKAGTFLLLFLGSKCQTHPTVFEFKPNI